MSTDQSAGLALQTKTKRGGFYLTLKIPLNLQFKVKRGHFYLMLKTPLNLQTKIKRGNSYLALKTPLNRGGDASIVMSAFFTAKEARRCGR